MWRLFPFFLSGGGHNEHEKRHSQGICDILQNIDGRIASHLLPFILSALLIFVNNEEKHQERKLNTSLMRLKRRGRAPKKRRGRSQASTISTSISCAFMPIRVKDIAIWSPYAYQYDRPPKRTSNCDRRRRSQLQLACRH